MDTTVYYVVDTGNGYIKGINIDRSPIVGGESIFQCMTQYFHFAKQIADMAAEYYGHEVQIKKVTVSIEDIVIGEDESCELI